MKARPDLLRARAVAVDVDRHEAARALDEILPVEERRLDLVARRAPLRAPVDEDRLVGAARMGERGIDLGVARSLLPCDAAVAVWRRRLRRCGRPESCVGRAATRPARSPAVAEQREASAAAAASTASAERCSMADERSSSQLLFTPPSCGHSVDRRRGLAHRIARRRGELRQRDAAQRDRGADRA